MVHERCSLIEESMSLLGRAWAGAIMRALLDGNDRYSDIRRAVPGVTDAVLSARLRELCAKGFAVRRVEAGPPTTVRYELTAAGRDVEPVLDALSTFALRHRGLLTES